MFNHQISLVVKILIAKFETNLETNYNFVFIM